MGTACQRAVGLAVRTVDDVRDRLVRSAAFSYIDELSDRFDESLPWTSLVSGFGSRASPSL